MSSLISLATIAVFILFLFYKKFPKDLPFLDNFLLSSVKKESGEIAEFKNTKPILLAILGFALFSRLLFLWNPPAFYFDEVYHAFTAQEIVRGNPAAWEYSATPPKGFAYEWTHPPLAKLFMAGGILSLGDNSFAWRFPGVLFGVGCVYLVFLLAKIVFKDEKVGLISAFLFSLDGMALVMSRIGMNDIYFLFFGLLTIILFLKDRYLFSALALGLAFSSKWTASFILITLFIAWLLYKRKFEWRIAFYFLMPPILYLASYTIFFTTGHDLIDFWHTQQQMWWYHTQLVATHPYSSPWWSWPLMLKPIWLYTSSQNGLEQNIYIAGNPAIFVGGFFAVLVSLYWSYKRKDKATLFVALCYLAMFLPWARSPRIMFLYHYLPAVPFMVILLAWILKRFWDFKQKNLVRGYFIIVIFLFILYYPFWTGIGIPEWWNALRF